ncbi:uncharacterized protein LOC130713301 [Lotus japonicus]|uniref:uncharacterized protein LOC130713301 n=1 Tax=Lotus japonicus TaxID=34305 RepID=UPI00258FD70C|nr:uncharacterized protein LOC130713301 [Lotus japonicus]
MYKVVSKLLANRLKKVLDNLISEQQFAFLGGRQMLDSVVVVNEAINAAKRSKKPTVIFKVDDYEKGLNLEWRRVLAPFLFLIVAEGLNRLFFQAVNSGKFTGFKFGTESALEIPLLQFADDTVFLGEATMRNIATIKCVLRCFELASGLKVNFHKSKLASVAVEAGVLSRFATVLNYKLMSIPFIYLGIPMGGKPRGAQLWDSVINKFRSKLSKWKQRMVSFGGRVCLIQSVLSALSLFFLSFFKLLVHDMEDPVCDFASIWATPAPSSARAFVWRLMLDRIQTRDNLRRRRVLSNPEELLCPFCLSVEESSAHLLFSCAFSMEPQNTEKMESKQSFWSLNVFTYDEVVLNCWK